jgi:hypothetical protein
MNRKHKTVAEGRAKERKARAMASAKAPTVERKSRPRDTITARQVSAKVKTTSVLRRVPLQGRLRYVEMPGLEGNVCAFQLASTSAPILIEAVSGRMQTLVPGDVFLGTPGNRESNIVLVGGVPEGGLTPEKSYWVISESGIVGELVTGTQLANRFLGSAIYLGTVVDDGGRPLALRQFAVPTATPFVDHGAELSLIVGTGPEVGKTTAGLALLRTFLAQGHATVVVLKATGTSSFAEIANYQDYGAAHVFDCVDFGLPTTYPSERADMDRFFDRALETCLAMPADAVLIECGGDMLAANIPTLLKRLKMRRPQPKVILAAADPLGALGGSQMLRDIELSVNLITGPCTDTPASQRRTQSLCKAVALNMAGKGN